MARLSSIRITRLSILIALAVALAGVAGVINFQHWRWAAARATSSSITAATVTSQPPADDRPKRILALSQYLAQNPGDRNARFGLAQLYFELQNYSRSLAELRTLERDHPKDPEVFFRQSVVLKYDGKPNEAEKAVRRALALKPDDELAREWLGEIHLDQGRYSDALAVFKQCLQKHPDLRIALLGKGRALEDLFHARHPIRRADILEPVEKAVRLDPNDPEGLTTLARMKFAYLQGLVAAAEAEQLALRATQLDPNDARPYITLAQIAFSRPPTPENLQQVAEYAYKAGQRDPNDPRPPYLIGRVALFHNDLDRAAKALELSLRVAPMPEAVAQLAAVYRRAGNPARASHYAESYQRYTELMGRRGALLAAREREPGEVRHYYALAALYLEAQEPDTAEQWLRKAEHLRPRDPRREQLVAQARALRQKGSDGPLLPIP